MGGIGDSPIEVYMELQCIHIHNTEDIQNKMKNKHCRMRQPLDQGNYESREGKGEVKEEARNTHWILH